MTDNLKEIRRKYDMHFYEGYEDDVHEAIGFLLSEIDRLNKENDLRKNVIESFTRIEHESAGNQRESKRMKGDHQC